MRTMIVSAGVYLAGTLAAAEDLDDDACGRRHPIARLSILDDLGLAQASAWLTMQSPKGPKNRQPAKVLRALVDPRIAEHGGEFACIGTGRTQSIQTLIEIRRIGNDERLASTRRYPTVNRDGYVDHNSVALLIGAAPALQVLGHLDRGRGGTEEADDKTARGHDVDHPRTFGRGPGRNHINLAGRTGGKKPFA